MGDSKGMTIETVVKDGLCCGCGTCAGVCPNGAIEMKINTRKGVYLPYLNPKKCNNCSLCYRVCPGWEVNLTDFKKKLFPNTNYDPLAGSYLQCYLGYANKEDLRYNCASGGLITAFLLYALTEGLIDGALVTKMDEKHPLEPKPFIARTREDIISAACSKYCPVPANTALREILRSEGHFAVVGLPCHLHGLRKAEVLYPKLRKKIVFRLGILCAKNMSFQGTLYQLKRMGIEKGDVDKINYRGDGWPGNMSIRLNEGSNVTEFLPRYYDSRFGSFVIPRCTLCVDGVAELADISFGDAWLPEVKVKDRIGTSIIITRSNYVHNVLLSAVEKGFVKLEPTEINEVNRSQQYFSWKKREIGARFLLNKLMGRKTPKYFLALPKPSMGSYFHSFLLGSQMFLASRLSWWKVLDIYCHILELAGKLKNKVFPKKY
jgi:coenzyme F420 hydrogenase subunit beta